MKKKYYIFLFIFFLIPLYVRGLEYPKIDSKLVEIYDINDDKILYEIGSKDKTSIASLTKIATNIVTIETIKDLDEKVSITKSIMDTVDPIAGVAGLKVGDIVTYRDLMYASMLPSGADATNALAILSSGSIEKHVLKMNELANKIGLKNTHFVNVTGLDVANHYSTIEDVRNLLLYALHNDLFKTIYTTRDYTLTNGLKIKSTIYKYNPGNRLDTSAILGSKSGHTYDAGYCLSSLSSINGHDILIILLKAREDGVYFNNIVDTINLIKFLNNNYKDEVLVDKGELIKTIPVKLSKTESYDIKSTKIVKKYLSSDYDKDKLKIEYSGLKKVSFINRKGQKIGTIKYYFDNELIDSEKVILHENIKIDLIKIMTGYCYILIVLILVIIGVIIYIFKHRKRRRRYRGRKRRKH